MLRLLMDNALFFEFLDNFFLSIVKKNVPKTCEISCFPSILITFCLYLLFDVLDIKVHRKNSVLNCLFFKPYFTKQTPQEKFLDQPNQISFFSC